MIAAADHTCATPALHAIDCPDAHGGHRMAYAQWGHAQAAHLVLCVHGLTRQGRDFDVLAQALAARAAAQGQAVRVVCPDVVGRGQSGWLHDPLAYALPTYAADMLCLLQHLHRQAPVAALDWVGTSMGGLIGMAVAGTSALAAAGATDAVQGGLPAPVRRLVLNDVGPAIEWASLVRIGQYLGDTGHWPTLDAAIDALLPRYTEFGPHTPAQWRALTEPLLRALPPEQGGGYTLRYDPTIAIAYKAMTQQDAQAGEATMWQLYDAITAQTLLLRGAESDLLAPATAQAMTERGPRARLAEFAGVGHAPTLIAPDQVQTVTHFLLA